MSGIEAKVKAIKEERAKDCLFEPDLSEFLGDEDKREKIYQRGYEDALIEVVKGIEKTNKLIHDLYADTVIYDRKFEAANKIIAEYNEWFHKKCWQPWIIAEKWKATFEQLNALYIPRIDEQKQESTT